MVEYSDFVFGHVCGRVRAGSCKGGSGVGGGGEEKVKGGEKGIQNSNFKRR